MLLLAGVSIPSVAQESDLRVALDLERRGNYTSAAQAYLLVLQARPNHVNALLGLERAYGQLARPEAMTVPATAALAVATHDPVVYGVAVRAWTAAARPDSVSVLVDRWAAIEPESEAPYREWGFAALTIRDREEAKRAYRRGRERIGPPALAAELAQLATLEADYLTAAGEWVLAMAEVPGYRSSAIGVLSQAPPDRQPAILAQLSRSDQPVAHQLAAALAVRWGDPGRGHELLARGLPDGPDGAAALHDFLDELRLGGGVRIAGARGRTLERLAGYQGEDRSRWLSEAARAFAEAGDQASARRVLATLASDPSASTTLAGAAAVTLVGVLIAEGDLAQAADRLAQLGPPVDLEERERLGHALAMASLRAGDLDRADALLVEDSSMTGAGIRGRLRLARGDLRGATADLAGAGPFGDDRDDATERASLLAITQMIDEDSVAGLGMGYLALLQGDSAAAAGHLARAARSLPKERGGGELLVWAGRLTMTADAREAEQLFREAEAGSSPAASAAAGLERASLLMRRGARAEAVQLLEGVILAYPGSTVAPQARRLLAQARGGIPAP